LNFGEAHLFLNGLDARGEKVRAMIDRGSNRHLGWGAGGGLRWCPNSGWKPFPGKRWQRRAALSAAGRMVRRPVGGQDDDGNVSPGEVLMKDEVVMYADRAPAD